MGVRFPDLIVSVYTHNKALRLSSRGEIVPIYLSDNAKRIHLVRMDISSLKYDSIGVGSCGIPQLRGSGYRCRIGCYRSRLFQWCRV